MMVFTEVTFVKSLKEKTCVICDQTQSAGIYLYTSFICMHCEEQMVKTETDDPNYHYYVQQLKRVTTPEILS